MTLLLAGCGQGDATVATTGGSGTQPASGPSGPSGPHDSADAMFATGMVPHHAQAVAMSDAVLAAEGVGPEVRDLARQIRAAQAPEIEQLRQWLAAWGYPVPDADDTTLGRMSGMHYSGRWDGSWTGHGGMMGSGDLGELRSATGRTAERLFLRQMIAHHWGAVMMSRMELRAGESPTARALAQHIIDSQLAEIATMRALLAGTATG